MSTSFTSEQKRKFWTTFLLGLFLGVFGAHRFYNKSPKAWLMLITLGGLGVWTLIDLVTILAGKFSDPDGTSITNTKPGLSWTIAAFFLLIGFANNEGGSGAGRGGSHKGTPKNNSFQPGEYGRMDGSRESLVRFAKDGSCYSEVNTPWGYLEKKGVWDVSESRLTANWSSIESPNNSVSPGDLSNVARETEFTFGRDASGDRYIKIGETRYWLRKK
jgi:hypothetical protein